MQLLYMELSCSDAGGTAIIRLLMAGHTGGKAAQRIAVLAANFLIVNTLGS